MHARYCPRCETPLQRSVGNVEFVEECARCSGVWISVETFERICADRQRGADLLLRQRFAPPARNVTEAANLPCPICARAMRRFDYARESGIQLDICGDHGIWFDAAELGRVIAFVQTGGLKSSLERRQPRPYNADDSRPRSFVLLAIAVALELLI